MWHDFEYEENLTRECAKMVSAKNAIKEIGCRHVDPCGECGCDGKCQLLKEVNFLQSFKENR